MNWPSHGSNPQYIYEAMNIPKPKTLIDLSANINPLGPPSVVKEKWAEFYNKIGDYPDPYATSLRKTIAQKEVLPIESVLIGNGGSELISLLGRMFSGKHVLIIQPTFTEYEKASLVNGCKVEYHHLNEGWELELDSLIGKLAHTDALFLCNPNNPTGICFPYDTILRLADACKQKDCYLVVDEAFYDFWKDYVSLTPILRDYNNVILLRSLTKMFAIPGLRLGYLLANQSVLEKLTPYQPHWSVNILAMLAGEECVRSDVFIKQTVKYIEKERQNLFDHFQQEGFMVSPSNINFYLLRDSESTEQLQLFEFLLRHGIVPRHTMNFPGLEGQWMRFAIKSTKENQRLLEVLKEWRQ